MCSYFGAGTRLEIEVENWLVWALQFWAQCCSPAIGRRFEWIECARVECRADGKDRFFSVGFWFVVVFFECVFSNVALGTGFAAVAAAAANASGRSAIDRLTQLQQTD